MRELRLRSTAAPLTRRLGTALGAVARGGDVVSLSGELGAGKTTLVQGLAAGLGVAERVTSPSFMLQRSYLSGRVPLVHVDVYRLDSLGEVVDLGLEELFAPDRVTVVEWGDAVRPLLPPDRLDIELRLVDEGAEEEARTVLLSAHVGSWPSRLVTVAAQFDVPHAGRGR